MFPAGSLDWWSSSWLVAILPFTDQGNLAQNLNFSEQWPFWNTNCLATSSPNNCAVLAGFTPSFLFCPSSSLPRLTPPLPFGRCDVVLCGHRGRGDRCGDLPRPDGRPPLRGGGYGFACSNGVLGPNMYVAAASIRNGLSNTLAIGEQSDWIIESDGTQVDLRSSDLHGAWIGAGQAGWPQNDAWSVSDPSRRDPRYLNCTTLRYPFGYKTDAGTGGGMGMAPGPICPCNRPIPAWWASPAATAAWTSCRLARTGRSSAAWRFATAGK